MAHGTPRASRSRTARWLLTIVVGLAVLAVLAPMASMLGPRSFVFAFNLHFILMAAAVLIDQTWEPRLDGRWFDVSAGEVRLYRRLGVVGFMRLLQRIGWTRVMRDVRVFDGTRDTLASYERTTRHSEHSHTWIFVVVLAPMIWAAAQGWWDAVGWLGAMNVGFHGYPVMLQRTQRARLRGVMLRSARLRAF